MVLGCFYAKASVVFNSDKTKGCVPVTINFSDNTPNAVRWEWEFGNGNKSTLKNPSAIYSLVGVYSVKLTVWFANGSSSTSTKTNYIQAFKNPQVQMAVSSKVVCVGKSITFSSNSIEGDAPITNWRWDLGDGSIVSGKTTNKVYTDDGTYNISLVITDGNGCSDQKLTNQMVKVNPLPVADIGSIKNKACQPPLTIAFNNRSSGTGLTYNWNFGNGNNSTATNPSVTYDKLGTFTITLTVTSDQGCTHSTQQKVSINPIKADFSASTTRACVGEKVLFTPAELPSNDLTVEWDFGNGQKSNEFSPGIVFSDPGKYTVSLRISLPGCQDKVTKTAYIEVFPKPHGTIQVLDSQICKYPMNARLSFKTDMKDNYNIIWQLTAKSPQNNRTSNPIFAQFNTEDSVQPAAEITTQVGCKHVVKLPYYIVFDKLDTVRLEPRGGCVKYKLDFQLQDKYRSGNKRVDFYYGTGVVDSFSNGPILTTYNDTGIYKGWFEITSRKKCQRKRHFNVFVGMKTQPVPVVNPGPYCNNSSLVQLQNRTAYTGIPIHYFQWTWPHLKDTSRKLCLITEFGKNTPTLPVNAQTQSLFYQYGTNVIFDVPGKEISIQLSSFHYLCRSDTSVEINIDDPFADIHFAYDPCVSDSVTIKNVSHRVWHHSKIFILPLLGNEDYPGSADLDPKERNFFISDGTESDTKHFTTKKFSKKGNSDEVGWHGKNNSEIIGNNCKSVFSNSYVSPYLNYKEYDDWWRNAALKEMSPFSETKMPFGRYLVKLRVKNDSTGCFDTIVKIFEPKEKIFEMGTPKLYSNCVPATLNWVPSKNDYSNILWVVNNKDTFRTPNFNRTFSAKGKYTVKVWAWDNDNCKKEHQFSFELDGGKLGGSLERDNARCSPIKLKLTDNLFGDVSSAENKIWIIGNKNSGVKIPVTAKIMEYNLVNGGDTGYIPIYLSVQTNYPQCFKPIELGFYSNTPFINGARITPNRTCNQNEISAAMLFQGDKNALPYTFEWDMGDGTKYNTSQVNHKFPDDGRYLITMKMTDSRGCVAIDTQSVFYSKSRVNINITADTFGSNCPPLLVNFKNLTTVQPGSPSIVKWFWDFGDKTFSTKSNPDHQYVVTGKFSVTLVATDAWGCEHRKVFRDFILINGPTGKFDFFPKSGCFPLQVEFKDTTEKAQIIEWDFGDGIVKTGTNPKHNYTAPGYYMPQLVITDAGGCKYIIPMKDTVKVYDYPKAQASQVGKCFNRNVEFISDDVEKDLPIKYRKWSFEEGIEFTDTNRVNFKSKSSKQNLKYWVSTAAGCSDSLVMLLKLYANRVNIVSEKDTICLGSEWKAKALVSSDTAIAQQFWKINNRVYTQPAIAHKTLISGVFHPQFIIENVLGCRDTFENQNPLFVGDTIPPVSVPLLRVSVDGDYRHEVKFKQHSNFDFSVYEIYRFDNGLYRKVAESKIKHDTVLFLTGVNALKSSYCYKLTTANLCRYKQEVSALQEHCTVEVQGAPLVNAALLKWNPYTGWPVKEYYVYREQHKHPGKWDSIGKTPADVTEFIDTNVVCYIQHTYKVLAIELGGNLENSWSDTTKVKSIYINHLPAPEIWRATVEKDQFARIEWKEVLNSKNPIDYYKIDKCSPGERFVTLKNVKIKDSAAYNDKKTEVDNYKYMYRVAAVDVCGDQSSGSDEAHTILLKTSLNEHFQPELLWTHYQEWPEGVAEYIVEKKNSDNSFTEIARVSSLDTQFTHAITELNCIQVPLYRITALRNTIPSQPQSKVFSHSNHSSPQVITKIYVPNAFTPNKDLLNENFGPKGIYILSYTMKIYNRWGEKLYESNECKNTWNGLYKGVNVPEGVYVYIIEAMGADGNRYLLKGDVTLLK